MQNRLKKTVLLYGFTDFAGRIMAGNLSGQLSGFDVEARIVEDDQVGLPMGMVLMGTLPAGKERQGPASSQKHPDGISGAEKASVPGRMIVMSGIDPEELEEKLLPVFYSLGLDRTVPKAMVTPYNAGWTGPMLYEELIREREEFRKREESHKK